MVQPTNGEKYILKKGKRADQKNLFPVGAKLELEDSIARQSD